MSENRLEVYRELCSSYRAIDDFRAKLLAFLPFATGGGIFLLLSKDIVSGEFTRFFAPIGAFGFLITLGLYAYEIYGIKKCGALIMAGQQIESWLQSDGQLGVALAKSSASSMSRSRPVDSRQGFWFR